MAASLNDHDNATCLGVDVGGTFTDVVLSDGTTTWRAKAPSTPGELGRGVLDACRLVAERAGTTLEALLPTVSRFGLGTTAVTNTIASRAGRRVGLITTAGFEDLVPIARAMRVPENGWLVPPVSLIDPEWIAGVSERVDRNGDVLTKLDIAAVRAAGRRLVDEHRVEALVVSFLWACVNDSHERLAVDELRVECPDLTVMSAADLLPVIREYERTQFALLNAYTSAALDGVDDLVTTLLELGLANPPLLVHSGGGSISVREGRRVPVTLAESGPAAGVVAALAVCATAGVTEAVTGDVGGTSFDVSLISGGQPHRRSRGELMGVWTALPMVDIDSVGAGGGSLGWVDPLGILRVGPQSAGADPGPACYGRGGTQATVTDALVVLGYIDPRGFLGGDMHLDEDAARAACARLGEQLGSSDADRAAWGIWEVAKAGMVCALRARFAERGMDPRVFTMISMGGCGGLFSAAIAQELHLGRVLVPELASVLSAFGAATSDVRRERSRSVGRIIPADPADLETVVADLTRAVRADLEADGVPPDLMAVELGAELRFHRQKFELPMQWLSGLDTDSQLTEMRRFTEEYASRYGQGALVSGAPVEIVSLRAIGIGHTVHAQLNERPIESSGAPAAGTRRIHQGPHDAPIEATVIRGADLRPGHTVRGPAIIDAADTTIWIPPRATARMDGFGTLDMELS
jgi:N-methylhydantoinase A